VGGSMGGRFSFSGAKSFGMMMTRDGVEPPPPAFSVSLVLQQLNFAEWPQFL